jgi:hypothetical protein
MSKNFYGDAISRLKPGNAWGLSPADELLVDGNGKITNLNWNLNNPDSPPTVAEIEAMAVICQQDYNANVYKKERERNYPPLGDLADALYWQSKGDETKLTAYLAAVEAVKNAIPKGA